MKSIKRWLSLILTLAILLCGNTILQVQADESKILTLGADLSEEQKQLVINYLGVNLDEVVVLTVTNEDEHALLDDIATAQQIGTRTFSCCYIEPTTSGGINVKTVNMNWVTCEMIRNALVTSGITNCNIVCVAPIEVSGTGALTGIFKAYENISGVELTDEVKELASEELITTCEIAEGVGQDTASSMLSDLKELVITNEIIDKDKIVESVTSYLNEHKIKLSEDQIWRLVDLLLRISQQDYNIEEVKQAYATVKQTVAEVKEATEKTAGFFTKIFNFFKELWQKITGTYEKIIQTEQAQAIKDQLGILANTNDDLLGLNTIVTDTVEDEAKEDLSVLEENLEPENEADEGHWYDFFINMFNSGNKKEKEGNNTDSPDLDDSITEGTNESTSFSFDDFQQDAENYKQEMEEKLAESSSDEIEVENIETKLESNEDNSGILPYVVYDFKDKVSEDTDAEVDNNTSKVQSFDDLTK